MIVYEIINRVNGKRYIGVTSVSVGERLRQHVSYARRGGKTALAGAIRKSGSESFFISPLLEMVPGATAKDLFEYERMVIAQEGTLSPGGYNLTEGGDGLIGYKFSEEICAKRRQARASEETKAKMSVAHKGKKIKRSAEGQARSSEAFRQAKLGKPLSEDTVKRIKATWTPEKRALFSERMKKQREANPNFGPSGWSEETRKKMSNLMKSRMYLKKIRALIIKMPNEIVPRSYARS